MRKFIQLAEDVENDLRELDADADELNARRLKAKERARLAINDQHRIQDRVEEGIAAIEKVAEAAGMRSNTLTAAELARIEAEKKAREGNGGEKVTVTEADVGKVETALGEASGGTPPEAGNFPGS